jgi:HD-like signal output (HDOD) protein
MSTNLPVDLSRELTPINQLSPESLKRLVQAAQVETLTAGTRLSASDCSRSYLYVLDGDLAVCADGKDPVKLSAGSPRALNPIFPDGGDDHAAQSLSPIRIARIDKDLFRSLLEADVDVGCKVTEVAVTQTENQLFQEIQAACSKGELQIPAMPEVAARLARMAEDPQIGLPDIARVVQSDPGVAGAVMHAANSALYCSGRPIGDLKSAVVRLGMALTRSLAASFALRQTFRISSPLIEQRIRALWEHSVDVSAMSYVLARKLKGFDPERALLAGLIHDIGAIPILTYIERSALQPAPETLDGAISKLRVMVGVLVANSWRLDSELATVIAESEDWMRNSGTEPDLCDVVLVAQRLHYARSPHGESLPPLDSLPAYRSLGLSLNTHKVVNDAQQEIAGVKSWLNA